MRARASAARLATPDDALVTLMRRAATRRRTSGLLKRCGAMGSALPPMIHRLRPTEMPKTLNPKFPPPPLAAVQRAFPTS